MSARHDPARWQRAQQLFDQVIDLAPAPRAAALQSGCSDDAELLTMVEGLIVADLQQAPDPAPAVNMLARLADPELAPGTRIGAFRIEKLLGSGGMGRVYLGRRADGRVEQDVAIKTIRGAHGRRDLLAHFERERRILARLNHPHIAHFVDAGETAEGAPFVAMEYIAGTPLLDYVNQRRMPLAARLRLFIKIASAVDYAHRQLVVHRDLKPGNVLVDAEGEPKLLDFGIAGPVQEQFGQAKVGTAEEPQARFLSLLHAAPEQVDGQADGVSVDLYALGGLLYELLTGSRPLELEGLDFAAARARIAKELPPAPSTRLTADLAYAAGALKGDLDRVVLHALEKQPERRYTSAATLIDDIERVLTHRPISLRQSQRGYLLARFLRRHRLSASIAAALLLTTVGAAVVYREQRNIAISERSRAEAASAILIDAFEAADPSRNKGERLSARDVLRQARHVVDQRADLDPGARTSLLLSLSEIHSSLGMAKDARALAESALASAGTEGERLRGNYRLAGALLSDGDGVAAKAIVERLRASDAALADPAWGVRLGLLLIDIESFLGKVEVLPLAARLHERARAELGADSELTEEAAIVHASKLAAHDGSIDRAAELVAQLLSRTEAEPLTPDRLELLKVATRIERARGNADISLRYAQRHLELAGRLYGQEHGAYVAAESLTARALQADGQFAPARVLYSASVERARRVYGDESAMLALVAHNAGDAALTERLDLARALAMTAIAVEVGPRAMPPDSRQMGFLWSTRALALLLADENTAALAAATRATTIFQRSIADSVANHAEAELIAAIADVRLGNVAAARARITALGPATTKISPKSRALTLARNLNLIPGKTS